MAGSPNPGGQHRRLIRTTIAQWVNAQRIRGVDHVYATPPPEFMFELYRTGTLDYSCLLAVALGEDSEDFAAFEGPAGPGGNLIHYQIRLRIVHRSYTPGERDWADDEDDYDRIVDGLKDCLRGKGRDLGRPDVVLGAGVWPRRRAIVHQPDGAYLQEGGAVDRWGVLSFTVGQYLP